MSFPFFPDELSEFCWTFLIFHPKIGEDLFFLLLLFRSHSLAFPNFRTTFRIFWLLSEFFDYFPNSRLLSEFWFTFWISAENGPGTGFLGSHFFPTLPGAWRRHLVECPSPGELINFYPICGCHLTGSLGECSEQPERGTPDRDAGRRWRKSTLNSQIIDFLCQESNQCLNIWFWTTQMQEGSGN